MSYPGMTFYFMRHGETYLNLYQRMQGWSNAPLTEAGKIDVRRSGRGLSDIKFDAVYTSDLSRTIETAHIILSENDYAEDLVIETMPQFREVFFGSYEGLEIKDVYESLRKFAGYNSIPEFIEDTTIPERMNIYKEADPYHHAEDFMTFWLRIERGLLEIVDRHKYSGDSVLVVVHGLVIRYMMMGLVAEVDNPENLLNASITRVQYKAGKFTIEAYNDTSHFIELSPEESIIADYPENI